MLALRDGKVKAKPPAHRSLKVGRGVPPEIADVPVEGHALRRPYLALTGLLSSTVRTVFLSSSRLDDLTTYASAFQEANSVL